MAVASVWGRRAAGILAALMLWCGTGQAALAASFIDYLYVEANEGDSSGGHVAIRFGDETFHFQHAPPGILRLRRQDAAAFHHTYALLGNRSIRESRIAVSDDTYTLLRDAFARLLLIQDAQLEIRDALHRDVALIDLLRRSPDELLFPVSGLGYFLADETSPRGAVPGTAVKEDAGSAAASPALASLRNRIRASYGELYLAEKAARARKALRGMELRAAKALPRISLDVFPVFEPTLSTRYDEALRALCAVQLLQGAPHLREGSFWNPESDAYKLEPQETLALKRFAAQLESQLVGLVDSKRTDWGLPFILGMGRLAAIEASLASGRLVLLDIFPPEDPLPARHDAALRPYLPMMQSEMREVFLQKRKRFFAADGFREADYAAMERSGNLLLDMERAMATGTPLRAVPKATFPSRPARVPAPPTEAGEATLARELAAAQAAERDYQGLLDRLYAYDLVHRNCVTEIFAVINRAVARTSPGREGEGEKAWSEQRLGGFVDATQGLAFIPFISAEIVESSYKPVETRDLPSYRRARLAEMKAHEAPLKVFLRESNTISSTVYRPGPGDSWFLFFTDDTVLLRPLFGAGNLVAGVGEALLGVLTMPVEGRDRFLSGARGVFFSLPELLFVNLRKGTMAYVEQTADP